MSDLLKGLAGTSGDSDDISEIVKRAIGGSGNVSIVDDNISIKIKGKTSQNARDKSGKMQTEDTSGQLPSYLQNLINDVTSGGMNKRGGRNILDQIASFVAEQSGGRGAMSRDVLGDPSLQQPPIGDLMASASGGQPMQGQPPMPPMPPMPPEGGGMPPEGGGMPPEGGAPGGGMPPGMMEALMGGGAPAGGGGMPPPQGGGGMPPELAGLLGPLMQGGGGGMPPIPGRAEGGPVDAGQPYMVGEQGPELMVPETGGEIVPNDELGGDPEAQLDSIIDQVMQTIEERGIDLLGPDGKLSAEALQVFMEILEGMSPAMEPEGDPLMQQMGGGPTPEPGADPLMADIMSGAGGGGGAPMPDMGGGGMAPDITGETPGGPDDISALLAALGG